MHDCRECSSSLFEVLVASRVRRDLLGVGVWVEGFEQDGCDAELGEAALIYALDFGGAAQDGNACDVRCGWEETAESKRQTAKANTGFFLNAASENDGRFRY